MKSGYITRLIVLTIVVGLSLGQTLAIAQSVTVHGYVRTMTGVPIKGATVLLVNFKQTQKTDSAGYYDFSKLVVGIKSTTDNAANSSYSLHSNGKQIVLNLSRNEKVSINLFDLSGKLLRNVLNKQLPIGNNSVDLGIGEQSTQLMIAKISIGSATSYYKVGQIHGNLFGFTNAVLKPKSAMALAKASLANDSDSIIVTHPNYFGGLGQTHTRKIPADTGLNNFRMFSNDTSATGWHASTMNFVFTPDTVGVSYYKQTVPNYVSDERATQREVQQSIWRLPSEVPIAKKFATYICDVNASSAQTNRGAWTGDNHLYLNPVKQNGRNWWTIMSLQHHEMGHSYQPWYNMTGDALFGEAIPSVIAALNGFVYWPAGTKCAHVAHNYYFIELKHPGYIYNLYKTSATTDIAVATQKITGESLSSLVTECEQKGMPYTLVPVDFWVH